MIIQFQIDIRELNHSIDFQKIIKLISIFSLVKIFKRRLRNFKKIQHNILINLKRNRKLKLKLSKRNNKSNYNWRKKNKQQLTKEIHKLKRKILKNKKYNNINKEIRNRRIK